MTDTELRESMLGAIDEEDRFASTVKKPGFEQNEESEDEEVNQGEEQEESQD